MVLFYCLTVVINPHKAEFDSKALKVQYHTVWWGTEVQYTMTRTVQFQVETIPYNVWYYVMRSDTATAIWYGVSGVRDSDMYMPVTCISAADSDMLFGVLLLSRSALKDEFVNEGLGRDYRDPCLYVSSTDESGKPTRFLPWSLKKASSTKAKESSTWSTTTSLPFSSGEETNKQGSALECSKEMQTMTRSGKGA